MPESCHHDGRADASHRQSLERLIVRHNERRANIAQLTHIVITLTLLAGALILVAISQPIAGAALVAATLNSPLVRLISGRASVEKIELFAAAPTRDDDQDGRQPSVSASSPESRR